MSAVLNFMGSTMDSLKSLLVVNTDRFVFQKIAFFVRILATNKQTDKQTDGQHQCVKPPSLSQEAA